MLGYRKSTLHAIAAVDVLARAYRSPRPRVTAAQLARFMNISQPSITKDLVSLERHGLIQSRRGRRGGYELACPPEQIRLADILRACGESQDHVTCLMGDETCECPLRERLGSLRQAIAAITERVSLRDCCDGGAS